eukprot:254235-Amphidinium_carterae.1
MGLGPLRTSSAGLRRPRPGSSHGLMLEPHASCILEGVEFSEPMEELGVPAPRGPGEPALEETKEETTEQQEAGVPPPGSEPAAGVVPADEPPPAEEAQAEALGEAPPATEPPLALPTDSEFLDAEE